MKRALLVLGLLAALVPLRVGASGATFVATTANPGARVSTAADFNTVAVALTDPGSALRGTVTLAASASSGRGIASVRFQTAPAGSTTWTDLCTDTVAPFTCAFDTTTVADGLRDVRVIALDKAGYTRTAVLSARRIDNTAPTATLADPGASLSGTVALSATATDAGSGVASVRIERAPAGTATWTTICTALACAWNTTTVADGVYDLRLVATDAAGNTRASATVAARRVDNAGPVVTLADPGSPLRRSVTLTATATDPVGVASVTFQRRAAGESAWTDMCKDSQAPYTCGWSTTGLADGSHDLRATAVDTLGHASASPIVAGRVVDNTGPRGAAIEAVNGGGIAGRIDAGDVLTFTYSEPMAPGSLLDGWGGERTDVSVRVLDGLFVDSLLVRKGSETVALTALLANLTLGGDHTTTGAVFDATMEMVDAKVIVTFGALTSGSTRTPGLFGSLHWTPAASATDLAGNSGSNASVHGPDGRSF